MIDLQQISKLYTATFGRDFCPKALLELVRNTLEKRQETFYSDLVSHYSTAKLIELEGLLSDKKEKRDPDLGHPPKNTGRRRSRTSG